MEQSNETIIAICGASGYQGQAVLKSLSLNKNYKLLFLTREPHNENNLQIIINYDNVEAVYCDFNKPLSVIEATEGVTGIFINTGCQDNVVTEIQQLKNIAIACKSNDIQKIVYSTLEYSYDYKIELDELNTVDDELINTIKVPNFDGKGSCVDYFESLDIHDNICFLYPSMYYNNFFGTIPMETIMNTKILNIPFTSETTNNLPLMDLNDYGNAVKIVFENFADFAGEHVGFSSEILSGQEIVDTLNETTKTEYLYKPSDYEYYKTINKELANEYEFQRLINNHYCYLRRNDVWDNYGLTPKTFKTWIDENMNTLVYKNT